MDAVTVREFSYNPSAMFARAEQGETIEVTRRGKVVAVLSPPGRRRSRYDQMVAEGAIIPASRGLKGADFDKFTRIQLPEGAPDPLELLLREREEEREEEDAMIREIKEELRQRAADEDTSR